MDANDIIRFVSDGFEKAKAGNALDVYASVADFHDQNILPPKSHYPFGWIIYYALHQSPSSAIKSRKLMLARYLRLSVTKPHKLHSMILTEAIRLYKDALALASNHNQVNSRHSTPPEPFSIVRFTKLWDLAYLRPGDHQRKEHEGKMLPSTVEKLITHYVDELYSSHTAPSPEFMKLSLSALENNPTSDNLYAQCARLHELSGEREKAEEMLRKAILASSSKFYLWGRLADLMSEIDEKPRLTVCLYHKALTVPGQEDFKGRIRLKLAKVLTDAGSLPHAKWELERVRRLYESKGWYLPRLYKETLDRIPTETIPADPTPIYRKLEPLADDYLYKDLPNLSVTKTYNKPGDPSKGSRAARTAWRVTDSRGNNYWFQPAQFNIPDNLPLGTPMTVKIFNGKVVKCNLTNA